MRTVAATLFALPLLWLAAAQAQETPHQYTLNQDIPETGTNITRAIVRGDRIPLNKRYSELTAEQQRELKSDYAQLHGADEPPFPIDGLAPISRAVANAQGIAFSDGELLALVDVDTQGNARSVSVVRSPNARVASLVTHVLTREKYKPAVCAGQPCAMQFRFHVLLSEH
jgi:hypothetical protein